MATVVPSEEARKRNSLPDPVPHFDRDLYYTIPQTAFLIRRGVNFTWKLIRDKKIHAFRDGGRTYVHGSEIVKYAAGLSGKGEAA